jgi:hypothetical protein
VDQDYKRAAAPTSQAKAGDSESSVGKRTLTESLGKGEGDPNADVAFGGIVKSVAVDDAPLLADASKPKDAPIAKLKKTDRVRPVDLGVGAAVNKGAEGTGKAWWKVSVIGGASAGKEGWMQVENLGSILKVTHAGKLESTTKVGDGSVDVHTGHALEREGADDGDNNFALTYTGKDAADAKWLQFIWREIVGVDAKGVSTPVKETITTTGGTYDLTDNGTFTTPGTPAKNNYNTDCPDPANPFYETVGEADRTADSTKMIDLPGAAVGQVKGAFKNGASKVASRAHFSTFLIKGKQVAFKTSIDVVWGFAKKEDADAPAKGAHTVSGSAAATALPATIAERFHDQYPGFKDIK